MEYKECSLPLFKMDIYIIRPKRFATVKTFNCFVNRSALFKDYSPDEDNFDSKYRSVKRHTVTGLATARRDCRQFI